MINIAITSGHTEHVLITYLSLINLNIIIIKKLWWNFHLLLIRKLASFIHIMKITKGNQENNWGEEQLSHTHKN